VNKEAAYIKAALQEAVESLNRLEEHSDLIANAGQMMIDSLRQGGKILFCGNGGSAADAQHLAAELMGRFLKEREPLSALALTVDTSTLTAIGNDYGYEYVFERQVRGIGRPGDVLVGISTSGNSHNVVLALKTGRKKGIATIGMTGANGGVMEEFCDLMIKVPAHRTDQIQQLHIVVGHALCGLVEEAL
jgi:D-sedoheptulose 7-phosphate isomerase